MTGRRAGLPTDRVDLLSTCPRHLRFAGFNGPRCFQTMNFTVRLSLHFLLSFKFALPTFLLIYPVFLQIPSSPETLFSQIPEPILVHHCLSFCFFPICSGFFDVSRKLNCIDLENTERDAVGSPKSTFVEIQ